MTPVNSAPIATLTTGFLKAVRRSVKPGRSASGLTAFFISSMPYISTAKPTRIVPISCRFLFFEIISMIMPARATNGAKCSGLSIEIRMLSLFIPAVLRSHAVSVVPMFEPIITPTVCSSCIIPEFTSPTSITVIAEEDCTAMVIPAPRARLLNGFEVIFFRVISSFPPAIFSRYCDMMCIPKRKNANPPQSVHTE